METRQNKIFDEHQSVYVSFEQYAQHQQVRRKTRLTLIAKILVLLALILAIAFSSCVAEEPQPPIPAALKGTYHYSRNSGFRQKAYDTDYSQYAGKTIKRIYYNQHGATSGDIMVTEFTDGTRLAVYAYKYTMEVCY